ncbi:hypothetical protein IFM89_032382 [Coptis chinensis]|uniref:Uncharacterized protein n=1 Tax=Coptis chinensis TaxID=261450 RepID=A0A835HUE4_9MAGN|nr:hypothetical protein IFM89_032382 [Coptis chinensis]
MFSLKEVLFDFVGKLFSILQRAEDNLSYSNAAAATNDDDDVELARPPGNTTRQPENWAKMVIIYSFPTVITLVTLFFQVKDTHHNLLPVYFVSFTLLNAFSFCIISLSLRSKFTRLSLIFEQIGTVLAFLSFFLAVQIILPPTVAWVAWVICVFIMLFFTIYQLASLGFIFHRRGGPPTAQ